MHAGQAIVSGQATDAQLAAFLTAWRMKEETPQELQAFAEVFSQAALKLALPAAVAEKVVDFAGPYNGRNSFFATVPVSILLANRGIPVLLHSSDSLPPKYGTSLKSILKRLGVDTQASSLTVAQAVTEAKIGFAWTEQYCSPLSQIRHVREEIGVRTVFNTIEKLLNLAEAKTIMLGAFHRTAIQKIIPALSNLSYEQAFIVQGVEGSEDLPVHRNSFLFRIENGQEHTSIMNPKDYGLFVPEDKFVKKLTITEQVDNIQALLIGERKPELAYYYEQTLLNAGVRTYLLGLDSSIEAGIEEAKKQLLSGEGIRQLQKWQKLQGGVRV